MHKNLIIHLNININLIKQLFDGFLSILSGILYTKYVTCVNVFSTVGIKDVSG